MNYQAYDWKFNASKVPTEVNMESSNDPWLNPFDDFSTCIGNACCTNGMIFDNNINQCIVDPNSSCKINTNVTNALTQKIPVSNKPDVILGGNNVKPNNTKSFINYGNF